MKKILLTLLVFGFSVLAKAQNNDIPTAILQHGDNINVFTGINALAQAHSAAEEGDVITLSAGEFNSTNIQKSITIYGAGFEKNVEDGTNITKIINAITIVPNGKDLTDVHLEGLYFNANVNVSNSSSTYKVGGLNIKRCYVSGSIVFANTVNDVAITECVVTSNINGQRDKLITNLLVSNCYLGYVHTASPQSTNIVIDHCILLDGFYHGNYSSNNDPVYYSPFFWTNCIFIINGDHNWAVGQGGTARNCICQNMDRCFSLSCTYENIYVVAVGEMFTDATNATYSATRSFELANPETWVGTDGTEIGINGGEGWSKVPGLPVVNSLLLSVPDRDNLKVTYDAKAR